MGLSTASVRHSHVMVMAPALTKTSKLHQDFNLPPHNPSTTSLTSSDDCAVYENSKTDKENLSIFVELLKSNGTFLAFDEKGERTCNNIMNNSPPYMDDQNDKMGLQKAGLETANLHKEKSIQNDVDQLFNNLPGGTDIAQMDELIQVIKSIESGSDKLSNIGNDLGAESDSMFQLSGTDIASNLSAFEKDLLSDVDVMNITIEEQLLDCPKETHSKDTIKDLEEKQIKLQRKLDFILRRLRKTQAKHMGQHVGEEVAGIFEHVHRTLRRVKDPSLNHLSDKLKPISQSSAKNLIRKLEMSASMQANAASKRQSARYFGSGSAELNSLRSALMGATTIPQWTHESKAEFQRVVGSLDAETRLLQEEIDSEATLSSSGGESCDEMQSFSNFPQQHIPIQRRALWRYSQQRSAIASRWSWLQAQIPDLEYRIRQYSDLLKQIRLNKGAVQLAGASPPHSEPTSPSAVNGYRGQLPGASPLSMKNLESTSSASTPHQDYLCSRTRPLINFKKRKLLQSWGLHAVSKKAARSSTIRCGCTPPNYQCALCTGRTDPTRPRELQDYLSKSERIALLDPGFHPVFSLNEDVSASTHLEAIMRTAEWQHRSTRPSLKTVKFITKSESMEKNNSIGIESQPKSKFIHHRRKYSRLLKSNNYGLSAKLKHSLRGRKSGLHALAKLRRKRQKLAMARLQASAVESSNEEIDLYGEPPVRAESRSSSPLLSMQSISGYKRSNRISSYDIDNIVIPYSVAASTRVEKLQYKEILTPKWRLVDPDFALKYSAKNNGEVSPALDDEQSESDTEDFTEEAVSTRHDKCEQDERKRFLNYIKFPLGYGRARSHKRTDSRAESSGGNSPDPMSPQTCDAIENANSPIASPLSVITEEPLPSLSMLRRRTFTQSLRSKDKEIKEEIPLLTSEMVEVIPYEKRAFPLTDDLYDKMLKMMPENHQFKTNIRSQDCSSPVNYYERRNSPMESESTESMVGDEDPNDPEWIEIESMKERCRR